MSNHAGPSNTSPSVKSLIRRPSTPKLVPVVEIPIRTRRSPRPSSATSSLRGPSSSSPLSSSAFVPSSSNNQHVPIHPLGTPVQTPKRPAQGVLTWEEAQRKGLSRLRPISCPWSGCDALLGSFSLFLKHLEKHYARIPSQALYRLDSKCPWKTCNEGRLGFVHELREHIKRAHLPTLSHACCPFKDCPVPYNRPATFSHFESYHADDLSASTSSKANLFRPHPTLLPLNPPPLQPAPIDPKLEFRPYLLDEVLPYRSRVARDRSEPPGSVSMRKSRSGSSSGPHAYHHRYEWQQPKPLAEVKDDILPDRSDPSVYFWPMSDEHCPFPFDMVTSSSIFPYVNPEFHMAHYLDDGPDEDEDEGEERRPKRREKQNDMIVFHDSVIRQRLRAQFLNPEVDTIQPVGDGNDIPAQSPFEDLRPAGVHAGPSTIHSTLVPHAPFVRKGMLPLIDPEMFGWLREIGRLKRKRKLEEEREARTKTPDSESRSGNQPEVVEDSMQVDGVEVAVPTTEPGRPSTSTSVVKGDETVGSRSQAPPYPEERVVRASKRLAEKHAGMAIGLGYWRERLFFEKRGIQLGELPTDHKL